MKKCVSVRRLKAALFKFSAMSSNIRPQKCRAYVVNLVPALAQIAQMQEETVHEALALGLPNVISTLGTTLMLMI